MNAAADTPLLEPDEPLLEPPPEDPLELELPPPLAAFTYLTEKSAGVNVG